MNKKILIGSIIAVAILVLVSFTGVVGYQTTKSSTIAKASPLFTVRSSRAIDEESKDLSCDYLGKDKGRVIFFPNGDNRQVLFQNIINQISMIDDKRFNNFVKLFINHLHNKYKLSDADIVKTLEFLYQLRDGEKKLSNLNIYKIDDTPIITSATYGCTIWIRLPRCFIWDILLNLFFIFLGLLCFVGILTTGPGP